MQFHAEVNGDGHHSLTFPPTLVSERPHWTDVLKRIVSPETWNFCRPHQGDKLLQKVGNLGNSATTCSFSDDESEASLQLESLMFDETEDLNVLEEPTPSLREFHDSKSRLRNRPRHRRSDSSISELSQYSWQRINGKTSRASSSSGNRQRLGSNSSLSLKTTDSGTRRRSSGSRQRLGSSCSNLSYGRRGSSSSIGRANVGRRESSCSNLSGGRLGGSCSNMSISSIDSFHRRSSATMLPELDEIWTKPAPSLATKNAPPLQLLDARPSSIRARAMSTTSQLSAITIEEISEFDEEDSGDELNFDLSNSENREEDPVMKSPTPKKVPMKKGDETKHVRNLSYCSSPSGGDSPICRAKEENLKPSSKTHSLPYLPDLSIGKKDQHVSVSEVPASEKHAATGKSGTKRDISEVGLTEATNVDPAVSVQSASSFEDGNGGDTAVGSYDYLPIDPVPQAACVSAAATIFSVGWAAVFWESPLSKLTTRYSIEVPMVGLENLYYIQLLTGGLIQLTSPIERERSVILVTPASTSDSADSGWGVQLISRRAGHCLVMEASTSTIKAQPHKLYILPVHLPLYYRSRVTMQAADRPGPDDGVFFAPFNRKGSSISEKRQPYAPNHQHEAAMHLRFSMEAALSMDSALRSPSRGARQHASTKNRSIFK